MIAILVVLFGTFAVVAAVEKWRARSGAPHRAGRIALAALFSFTGLGHFLFTAPMAEMVPPPLPPVPTVIATGVVELLGAVGLLIGATRRVAAWALFAFLLAVFPANVYAAIQHTGLGGHVEGPSYLWTRGPLQILFLAWTWYFGIRPKD